MTDIKIVDVRPHLVKLCKELTKISSDLKVKSICADYLNLISSTETPADYVNSDVKAFAEQYIDCLVKAEIPTDMALRWDSSDKNSVDNPILPIGKIYHEAVAIKDKKELELKSLPAEAAANAHEKNGPSAILLHICRAVDELVPGKLTERLTKIKQDLKIVPRAAATPMGLPVNMMADLSGILGSAMAHPAVKNAMVEMDKDARNIKGPEDAIKLLGKVMGNQDFMGAIGGIVAGNKRA